MKMMIKKIEGTSGMEERLREKIEKRAKSLVAMGLVARNGKRFKVHSPSLRGKQNFYEVWKDGNGQIKCNCVEYEEFVIDNPKFRCEHILAVKYFLDSEEAKNQEGEKCLERNLASEVQQTSESLETDRIETDEGLQTDEDFKADSLETKEIAKAETFNISEVSEPTGNSFGELANQKTEAVSIKNTNKQTENSVKGDEVMKKSVQKSKNQSNLTPDFEEKNQVIPEQENFSPGNLQISGEDSKTESQKTDKNLEADEGFVAQKETATVKAGNVIKADFSRVLRKLREQVDPNLVKQKEGWRDSQGNAHYVDYVEWHTVADILDEKAPNWSHSIREIRQIGNIVTVTVAITIDGVTREGIGTGAADSEMGIKKAEHDALKRAAVKFGVARDLYKKESEVIEREGAVTKNPRSVEFPVDPIAKSAGDLPTSKQFGLIRILGREIGIDVEKECQEILGCNLNEISKRAASAFINYLQELQRKQSEQETQSLREAV
jgi:predicted nucleic acid-binding Zn finger protein